jgi:hypothetical protein
MAQAPLKRRIVRVKNRPIRSSEQNDRDFDFFSLIFAPITNQIKTQSHDHWGTKGGQK